jgi:hypothetical protein
MATTTIPMLPSSARRRGAELVIFEDRLGRHNDFPNLDQ